MDTTRPAWMPAQVTVESNKPFHIIMEGQATNGGFAVDDIIFTPGSCPSKIYIILFKIITLTLGRYLPTVLLNILSCSSFLYRTIKS